MTKSKERAEGKGIHICMYSGKRLQLELIISPLLSTPTKFLTVGDFSLLLYSDTHVRGLCTLYVYVLHSTVYKSYYFLHVFFLILL
jgi:hypothetical protein